MSPDLVTQLLEYGQYLRAEQEPIRLSEVVVGPASASSNDAGSTGNGVPRRPRRRVAMLAAAAIVLLAGGMVWLSSPDEQLRHIDDSPVTTASTTSPSTTSTDSPTTTSPTAIPGAGVSAPPASVGPGAWTVAATLTLGGSAERSIASIVDEVRTWTGVIDVAEVTGASAWLVRTGLASDCTGGETAPPCGSGVAVWTVDSSMGATALRLRSEFAMSVLTAIDVPERFVTGYLDAAIDTASPSTLEFDPSPFGDEQRLTGPLLGFEPEVSLCDGPCYVAVTVDTDGVVVTAGVGVPPPDSPAPLLFAVNHQGAGYSVNDLFVDRAGHGGVLAELRGSVDGRRTYALAFLPLEAALIQFELADGSKAWQRPLAGMAIMVDQPGTGSNGSEPPPVGPFIVLDASGREIMHIEDTLDGPIVDDLRVNAEEAATATGSTPTTTEAVPGYTAEVVATVDRGIVTAGGESRTFADHVVVVDGVLWLHTRNENGEAAVIRLDPTTRAVGRIPIDGFAGPMVASSGAIWVASSDGQQAGAVSRIDLASNAVSARIEVPNVGQRPIDLIVAEGGLWVTGSDNGYLRIDLVTLVTETYPDEVGQGGTWVGEIDGYLWSYDAGPSLVRIDPKTGEIRRYDAQINGGPSGATLAGNSIWLATWDGVVARFDAVTGEFTDRFSLNHVVGWHGILVDGAVWFLDATGTINQIDAATAELVAVVTVERPNPFLMTAHDGAIWVAHPDGVFSRVDIQAREVSDVVQLGDGYLFSVASDEEMWLVSEDGTISRITPTSGD